ncbi:MerR family transcriptional regulator [Isoptericola sp. JC619]|uniref:MerR family transcriptional regulator n=2 Tax=Isoptericola sediminis TaxID=2733572 RepID=A0A849K251_9MICO|nr:MerR family transcriptional regulator [Isoptericola sediminis]NNU26350.1 MerR family transcriptional regulator [Isoptericola sediminis]
MRISGLAERTGVPVATIKYYLREGLVPAGEATSRTQASYGDRHVDRVRLVRALTESGGLSLAGVRDVLAALDDPPASRHALLGAAQGALLADESADVADDAVGEGVRRRAAAVVAARGWYDDPVLTARLAVQLRDAERAGVPVGDEHLEVLCDAAERVARADLATVPAAPAAAMRQVVVGTLLTDAVLLTLRRFAQQQESGRDEGADGQSVG